VDTLSPPSAIGCAERIVSTAHDLWVAGAAPDTLQRYEADSLARVLTVDLGDLTPADITGTDGDSICALIERNGAWQGLSVDPYGRIVETVTFGGIRKATAFAFLRRSRRFVVLAHDGHDHQRLYWFNATGGDPSFSLPTAPMHSRFRASLLATDGQDRVFLAGADDAACGGQSWIVILDADGDVLGTIPVDQRDTPITGIAASRGALVLTGPLGLLRFDASTTVPDLAGAVRCSVITPVLFSPDREDGRRWLRVEATGDLPEGTSLEIAVASTDDAAVRDRLQALAADTSITMSARAHRLLGEPEIWRDRTEYRGNGMSGGNASPPVSARLFQIRDRYLWIAATLIAAPGAPLPRLSELAVLYPGKTLMENLPTIYQRDENQPDGFLRNFMGVLEATTQGIDARIASIGSLLDPATAPGPWLDFVARWLGVPWDDAMEEAQKRRLLGRSADLAKGRGTRAGLDALLSSLFPATAGTTARYRVTDATADFGFAIVGGDMCAGTALPAVLGGRTRWSAELDGRAVLGYMRLPCEGQIDDGTYQLTGRIRVEIAATSAERQAWKPWLRALLSDMVPLTARLELRWVTERDLRTHRLDGSLVLESEPAPHLGIDAFTNLARLPDRGVRLSTSGPSITTRLR
jgi:phage tail-like protein